MAPMQTVMSTVKIREQIMMNCPGYTENEINSPELFTRVGV